MSIATTRPLTVEDLGSMPSKLRINTMYKHFCEQWDKELEKPAKNRHLVGSLFKAGGAWKLFISGILHCTGELINLIPTYIISILVSDLEKEYLSRIRYQRVIHRFWKSLDVHYHPSPDSLHFSYLHVCLPSGYHECSSYVENHVI